MKVSELIAGSTFTAGASRDAPIAPRVTVILPTFRRGDSGLLQRSIESLVAQTFSEFEIIVVDDASTDSTAAVVADAMRRDPRISVIRHPENIGLPAISEYEAFLRARGDLISFAFDDTVFEPDALERLVAASAEAPDAMIAARMRVFSRPVPGGGIHEAVLGQGAVEGDLLIRNPIPNGAVLMPKAILEDVGLYDPHIAVARVCDVDLWRRVRRAYRIVFLDATVGEEHGPATDDSIGVTYPHDPWVADDRMRLRRNESLRPDVYGEVDVFESAGFSSSDIRRVVERRAGDHVASRPWMALTVATAADSPRVPRVLVVAHPLNASTLLAFEAMREHPGIHVQIIDRNSPTMGELVGADVLVISRDFASSTDWSSAAVSLGIPVFYYLDDNLPLMFQGGELDERWAHFAPDAMRHSLEAFAGVLASSEPLAESFRQQGIHPNVHTVDIAVPGAIVDGWRRPPASTGIATFAFFIGDHRLHASAQLVLPALSAVVERTGRRVRLVVPATALARLPELPEQIELHGFATSLDYFVALRDLRDLDVDTVVVPPSGTANQRFKTIHPLLTSTVLGARLVAPDHPPYSELASVEGVVLVREPDSQAAWEGVLEQMIGGAGSEVAGVPAELLATRFSGLEDAERLLRIVAPQLPPRVDLDVRRVLLAEWFARQLAHSREVGRAAATRIDTEAYADVVLSLHRVAKTSRRLHALSRWSGPLGTKSSGRAVEVSEPLHLVPYLEYAMHLGAGVFEGARLQVIGGAAPGDFVGIELIAPDGTIVLHTLAALSSLADVHDIDFRFPPITVDVPGDYLVRVFAQTRHPVAVLEEVSRGALGLGRAKVRLMFELLGSVPL